MNDPYVTLGVPRSATADEIKKAYRKLAKRHHPDVNPGNKKAEEKFKDLATAFEVIGDPKKRALWDEFGELSTRSGFDENKARAYQHQASSGFEGMFGGDSGPSFSNFGGGSRANVEDLFGEMFARRRGASDARRRGPQPGPDIEGSIEVDLRDAVLGAERELMVEQTRLKVRIPPGVATGSRIRLTGQGSPGFRGGPPGDLYLTVRVREHPLVRVNGRDLELDLPITALESLRGADATVPTFEGAVTLKLPPGSQTGRKLRLRGKGLPGLPGHDPGRGDLYVVVRVLLPPPGDEALKAAEALEKLYPGDVRAGLVL